MYIVIENLFFNNSQLSVYENFLNEKTNGIKNFNLLQLIKHYFDTNALKTNFGKKDFSIDGIEEKSSWILKFEDSIFLAPYYINSRN